MSIISLLELAGVAHLPKAKRLIESVVLIEGYKEAQVEFGSVAGEEQSKQAIDQFRDLVNRNQVQGNERNIDYWRKQGWDQFSAFVQEKSQQQSTTQIKRAKTEGRSITVKETSEWLVVVPIDKEASCFHGKNTDWCTTKPYASFFEDYFYNKEITLIYFLKLNSGDKWAIAAHSKTNKIEMFDRWDHSISATQFQRQTGFNPTEIRNQVMGSADVTKQTTESRTQYKAAVARLQEKRTFSEIDPVVERDLMYVKKLEWVVEYCVNTKKRWPWAEKVLLYTHLMPQYINGVLGGRRDPAIEQAILKRADPTNLMVYARDVVKGRWPEAETAIIKDPDTAFAYVEQIIQVRWPEAEHLFVNDASLAFPYASRVIQGRWPEAELVILRSPQYSEAYTKKFLSKDDWEQYRDQASKDPMMAVLYATNTGPRRIPELERLILTDAKAIAEYGAKVLRTERVMNWPDGERALLALIDQDWKNIAAAADYVERLPRKYRWTDLEEKLLTLQSTHEGEQEFEEAWGAYMSQFPDWDEEEDEDYDPGYDY